MRLFCSRAVSRRSCRDVTISSATLWPTACCTRTRWAALRWALAIDLPFVCRWSLRKTPSFFPRCPPTASLPTSRTKTRLVPCANAFWKNSERAAAEASRLDLLSCRRPRELEMLERVRQRKVEFERQMQQGRNSPHVCGARRFRFIVDAVSRLARVSTRQSSHQTRRCPCPMWTTRRIDSPSKSAIAKTRPSRVQKPK